MVMTIVHSSRATFQKALFGSALIAIAACSDQSTEILARESAGFQISGPAQVTLIGFDSSGNSVQRTASADLRISIPTSTQGRLINSSRVTLDSSINSASLESAPSRGLPTFGAQVDEATKNSRETYTFKVHSERIAATRSEGKLVETFLVRKGGGAAGKPVGLITRVDGKMMQYVESEFNGNSSKPRAVRVVQMDADLRIKSDITVDLSNVNFNSRVAVRDIQGLRNTYGRLLRGLGGLVLPDQLHAQGPAPCDAAYQDYVEALIGYTAAVVASTAAAVFCGVVWLTCPAFVAAGIAAAAAGALTIYRYSVYQDCINNPPSLCDEPPCDLGGGGGGGSGGGGSGSGGGSSGGGGSGGGGSGGSGGGGLICDWFIEWWVDTTGALVTNSWIECHTV